MERNFLLGIDLNELPSPCYIIDDGVLKSNLAVLESVQQRTGAKILLALKAFAMFSVFPLIKKTLHGICASSVHEAKLGNEEFGREVHSFAAAYGENDLKELLQLSDHIVFNSLNQWENYKKLINPYKNKIEFGLRINPEHSEGEVEIYDPCARYSRLGVTSDKLDERIISEFEGLHFHTLCEQDSYALERTLKAVEDKFSHYFTGKKWINFGGGHHITRKDYNVDHLCSLINDFKSRYPLDVYLEPGEAIVLNAGYLVSTVLDVVNNGMDIAILDTSPAAHMPDVLEMPYRPNIFGAAQPGELSYTYRMAGLSCLAGDIIGDYSFKEPLKMGDKVIFMDMAQYTMVKNTTFNGIGLPAILLYHSEEKRAEIIREFGYNDFKVRLS